VKEADNRQTVVQHRPLATEDGPLPKQETEEVFYSLKPTLKFPYRSEDFDSPKYYDSDDEEVDLDKLE
jgi:hypothetical protein